MTLIDISHSPLFYPSVPYGNVATGQATIDAAGDAIGWVCDFPVTGTLEAVGFCCNSHTTTATVSFQLNTVNQADGKPTTTAYVANATGTVSCSGQGDFQISVNGGTGVSVTAGDQAAFLLFVASGSPNFQLRTLGEMSDQAYRIDYPYGLENSAGDMTDPTSSIGSISTLTDDRTAGGAFKIDGVWYSLGPYSCLQGSIADSNDFYTTGSTYDGRGMRFKPPFAGRVTGLWSGVSDNNGTTYEMMLTNSSGDDPPLGETGTLDKDATRANGNLVTHYLDSPHTFAADEVMYVWRHVLSGTARMEYIEFNTRDPFLAAGPSRSIEHYGVQRDSSAYTTIVDVGATAKTRVFPMGLIIDQIHDGAGGGGGVLPGVGRGVMRGM